MSWLRRKSRGAPARQAHPDPLAEAELQRIISLQKAICRKEEQLGKDQDDIDHLRRAVRKNPGSDYTRRRHYQIADLQKEMAGLEKEITSLHDQIAERLGALNENDASYLNPGKK
jgi:hypothetical protein